MQSFYNGLGAMTNFSRGLDNVSNNISNMNTPGYKGQEVFMRSLGEFGSQIDSSTVRSEAGDLKQTDSETDLAITGNGYFVLRNDKGEYFYTRVGQFQFNEDDILVDFASGHKVMALDELGVLREINISNSKLLPPEVTSEIRFVGNLDSGLVEGHVISDIAVYDSTGKNHNLVMEFNKEALPAENTWNVEVRNSEDAVLTSFQIQFGPDSTPLAASSLVNRAIVLGGETLNIAFNFGEPGSFAGATQLISSTTNLAAIPEDGHEAQGLSNLKFNEDGEIKFTYANGDEETGQQLALAYFNDPTILQISSKGLLSSRLSVTPSIGKPNHEAFGQIQSRRIEMSNVDLTQEFADILIIQRGYQASSRVMSVSNELIEQLYNNTRSR